jgi:hypothetical protein
MLIELRTGVIGLLVAAVPAIAQERTPPTPAADISCSIGHPVREVSALDQMPSSIVQFMASHAGGMAGRGAFFNDTDVIFQPAPMRRFIRAGEYRNQWFLAYETGGIAYSRRVALFETDPKAKTARPLGMSYYFNSNACVLIDKMLDGEVSSKSLQAAYW